MAGGAPSGRDTPARKAGRWTVTVAAVLACAACTPALNWRDVRLDDGRLLAQFPCKPDERSRDALLQERRVRMTLHSCNADGANYAIVHADVQDPARVATALAEWRHALAANLGAAAGTTPEGEAFALPSMAPDREARRLRLRGRLPEGDKDVSAQAL